jgi:cysteine desulfurase NifS
MAELARRLGYGDRFPQSEEELLHFALQGSGHTVEDVRRAGGWVKRPAPVMEYRKWEKGSLRPDGRPGFDTPTGKFEILSTTLEEHGYEPLPKYVEPPEGPFGNPELALEFPLVFNSGARPQTDFRSQHHGIEGLLVENPEPTVEINEEDAGQRGIRSGDLVEVRTPRGRIPFRARVTPDIVMGAVECNMGGGTPVGPPAWREWNVNELTDLGNYDEISGFPVYKALLCEVSKVEDATPAVRKAVSKQSEAREAARSAGAGGSRLARRIYLDNNATTRLAGPVREAMLPYLEDRHGNPSSIDRLGRDAREAMETARRHVARLIHARPRRVVFTGGGSEADNLALKGVCLPRRGQGGHVVTTAIEHPAVLKTASFLERNGFRVTYLAVDGDGFVSPDSLRAAMERDTILVSVMMANNEVGTLQPIKDLCAIAHQGGALFHTDAVQAAGKVHVNAEDLDVDLLTLSGHKFHGPKGVGVLYVKKGVELEPLIHGGKQEAGHRAGTENLPGIAGLGKAAELALKSPGKGREIRRLRDELEEGIRHLIPGARLNGHPRQRLPNTLNLTLPGLRGESLVVALDQHGVSAASGSACKSGSPDPTHVLLAMGRSPEEAHCAVRFSLSSNTTRDDIRETLKAMADVLREMEETIRFLPCK